MSIFSKLFGTSPSTSTKPDILFGRYSDAYKSETKYDAWDRAVEQFESQDFMQAWHEFFDYLLDESQLNLRTYKSEDRITFEILQGSKKITGTAEKDRFRAEAKIATVKDINIGFMRKLIEDNYNLKYGRYCLDKDNDISIVFDSLTVDGSPYKLYYGLKEIALAADKQDDLLLDDFEMLEPVNTGHITAIPEFERNIKTEYLKDKIRLVLKEINEGKLNAHQYPGGITYLLLDIVYRLDYLTRPEGYCMEAFERMHRSYFAVDGLSNSEKNHYLIKELKEILNREDAKLAEEFYRTKATFGIVNATSHEKFKEIVAGELDNMDWYVDNRHEQVALAVPGYIVGHALFYYSLPEPDKDLLLLYYQIVESDFFRELGFRPTFQSQSGILNKPEIKRSIGEILQRYRNKYPNLAPDLKLLTYDSLTSFCKSYLLLIANLDLSKVN
jgi:hypothetical protein